MAAASDKARFFLEQSVPELKEYERKKIFSPEEISSIARKRSDFEHKVNARGSPASEYARYAECGSAEEETGQEAGSQGDNP
jgi:U3 small nucleolar RNA-associated protein 6